MRVEGVGSPVEDIQARDHVERARLEVVELGSKVGLEAALPEPPACRTRHLPPPRREFKLPWREAGPPNHHDDTVDSDQ